MAASARCTAPLSGPIQRSCESLVSERQNAPGSAANSSNVRPTTRCSCARIAAQTISFPRPMVKVDPWPSSGTGTPPAAAVVPSVCRTT